MPSILGLITDPLGDLIKGATDIIGKFVADPDKKIDAQLALAKLQSDFQNKTVDADIAFANAQRDVIVSEAKSESWMARNWRPMIMLMFGYIIFHDFIIAQLFSLKSLPIPTDLWDLIKLGMGGYIIGRSAEKIAPHAADVVTAFKGNSDTVNP